MAPFIYALCALTAALCAWALLQAHGRTQNRLLLWSGLFFAITTLGNLALMVDKLIFPALDFSLFRYGISLAALGFLLRGLLLEVD